MMKTTKDDGYAKFVAIAWYNQGGYSWGSAPTRKEAIANVRKAARRDFGFRGQLKAMLYDTGGKRIVWYRDGTVWNEDNRNIAAEGEFVEIAA